MSTNFPPVAPHFHRMLLQDDLFDNKLKISREFMLKYGTKIDTSKPVVLKVPSGGAWEVKLTKYDDHVWLGEGWPDFARHHFLQRGYSLFFRYEGQSRFYVVIVDENGCEIYYPVNNSKHFDKVNPSFDELPKKGEENKDFHCDENVNSQSPYSRRMIIPTPPFPSPKRKMRGNKNKKNDDEYTCYKEQLNIKDSEDSESEAIYCRFKARAKRSMTVEEKDKALYRTKNFTSRNPFFRTVIQKTHVHDRYDMALQSDFWRQQMAEKSGYITLYVPHQKKELACITSYPN
ncbi:B3 domain-containing transcription factor VRN1-like isoform X2 [Humulus lupulus]|uniref:B3 domain-containing transcription factor VRN1-like isoform X2 n=1 Tax=Humulus lupulus TaxID=3486 RepID=UPI002B40FB2D|nr:B3 domain-containing transcription factor VRN1-like isoform X2 [Humulus lupulus]